MKTEQIQERINPDVKKSAESVFNQLGIKPSEAVRLFYHQVTLHQGLPFDLRIPNEETVQALKDASNDVDLEHSSAEDFFASL